MKRIKLLLRKARKDLRKSRSKSPSEIVATGHGDVAQAHSNHAVDQSKPNISRFFVEHRHISWVMLIAVCVWGVFSYRSMPQRKDPDTPVKTAVAITVWPGASAEQIEQLVTRKVEEKVAQNSNVDKIK